MDVVEAIKSRKSIRGFKPDPVPEEILKEILEISSRAPSAMNTQPWEFTVITGEVLDKIKQANEEKFNSGEPTQASVNRGVFTGKYRERQIAIAVQLFQLMDIPRGDKEKNTEWAKRGYRFFDAPVAIIISVDESIGIEMMEEAQFDLGVVSQNIALAALNYGLVTCIHEQGVRHPEIIKKFTGIPESKRISICISVGYLDSSFPANNVYSEREPIENITTYCSE